MSQSLAVERMVWFEVPALPLDAEKHLNHPPHESLAAQNVSREMPRENSKELYNSSWIRPSMEERPEHANEVENGCYW